MLIRDLLDNKASVNLFTRPRRFGKTLNVSMLQYSFENSSKDNSYLFENLNIMKAGEKHTAHMGQYPVINLSLKSAKQPTFELAYIFIRRRIVEEYKRNEYILENEHFGFTQKEVNKILEDYGLSEKEELTKGWYNGYILGQAQIYNPWSVVKFVKDLYKNKNVLPTSYWANTSSNSIVKSLIERADSKIKQEIELLIEGKTIEKLVHEDITLEQMLEFLKETHYSCSFIGESDSHQIQDLGFLILFFTRYFKKVNERMDSEDKRYLELSIPNREVKYIFRTKILNWFEEKVKAKDLSILYTAIFEKDSDTFQKELNKLLRDTIICCGEEEHISSGNDGYTAKLVPRQALYAYHGFVVGVLANMHDYIVKSNRETGDGRSDIYIKSPSIFEPTVIIELKICHGPRELLTKCDEALEQIENNKYELELKRERYENIIKYGISFYRKDCMIKKVP